MTAPSDPTQHRLAAETTPTVETPDAAAVDRLRRPAAGGVGTDNGTRLELVEEQLEAHTRPVQIGEVLIRKEVVTETRSIQVPVRREELVIERRAVEHRSAERPEDLGHDEFERSLAARFRGLQEGETIRLALVEDEVVVQKRPVVYEEVLIGKRAIEETQQVSGTVRREELKVARRGEVDVSHVRRSGGQLATPAGTDETEETTA